MYSILGFNQPMSSISHLCGAVFFAVAAYFLLQPVWHNRHNFYCMATFALSAVLLLSLSGTYHMFTPGTLARAVMLRLDIAAIFLLIAGSFTPVHGILLSGWRRWGILVPIWCMAFTGIALRSIFGEGVPNWVGTTIFLTMGWFGAVSVGLLWRRYGMRLVAPFCLGGMIYTVGAVADLTHWPIIIPYVWGSHETFHFAVLGGLSCHWWAATLIAENRLTPTTSHAPMVLSAAPRQAPNANSQANTLPA